MISNVLYENIILDAPEQWAVWIGPAQQSVSSSLCNPHPCRLIIKMAVIMAMMTTTMVMMMMVCQHILTITKSLHGGNMSVMNKVRIYHRHIPTIDDDEDDSMNK